eukprot:scaffold32086_cov183-Amphora_coffeaeformis.AAC.13
MEAYLKGKSNDTPRQAAEKQVAEEFLSILQRHHRDVRRSSASLEDAISVPERKILARSSYQNWTLGLTAGAVTFGVLTGIALRSAAAASRYQLPKRAPSGYRDLDSGGGTAASRQIKGAGGKRNAPRRRQFEESLEVPVNKQANNNVSMDPMSSKSDVMTQVQYMVFGATAVVVTLAAVQSASDQTLYLFNRSAYSTVFSDRDEFYRQVGRLPLISGKSQLSEAACPDLIHQYRNLLSQQQKGLLDHDDMLRHPQTVELDSMFQLVLNCRQRAQFSADMRVREKNSKSTSSSDEKENSVIDVPSPGVPFNYLGIPVTYETSDHKGAEDIVDEYDWLRKLVLDRSSY